MRGLRRKRQKNRMIKRFFHRPTLEENQELAFPRPVPPGDFPGGPRVKTPHF